ncbi:PorP/SprF family type IX secretion system membrane protein [Galbibacter mesophilus]|uniref:PorP/SprF family type IX secretion system membrane protein n=1 Tax=Galbibacter mesophilus TaxID=379069 RepID=UPI00191FEE18|nr:type IX secretion system membrane protein PorP/SprF [Galbibacter mesophilus]MCM5663861.1 type IX secretion system membrane protein PorP/SprF [Galbibacter mesophilus]
MNYPIRLLIIIISFPIYLATFSVAYGQQNSQYTQYMYNTITINPAYAGSRGMLSLNGLYRSQWVGLDGAPETMNFSANTPVGVGKVGLGLSFVNDRIGPTESYWVAADFAYTIRPNDVLKLSFGLKGGLNSYNLDVDKLNPDTSLDPNLFNINKISAIIGFGFYLHTEKWYVGLSSPNVLETRYYDDVATSTASERAHFYLIGGYVFDLGSSVKFKPALLTKASSGSPLSVDLSANFLFNDKFTLGAAYRWGAAISGLAAFQISDQLMIGYAYDYDTTELGNYNSGSHEIILRFEFGRTVRRVVSPRFF